MLFSLNDLIGFSAVDQAFEARIVDVFLERDSWKISHLALDTGGVLEQRLVIVPSDVVAEVIPDERKVKVTLKAEFDEARATLVSASALKDGDVSVLPRLIFGADKAALAQAFYDRIGDRATHVSFADVAASTAANDEAEIGRVIGFLADPDGMTARYITVDTGVTAPKSQHVLPVALVKRLGTEGVATLLDIDKTKLTDSPPLEDAEGLDRHWRDKVASYYGLT